MTFKEIRDMILQDYNNPNSKCYQDLRILVMSYSRKKKIKPEIIKNTSFIDDIFKPTKQVPEPNISLRIYCIINDIDSSEKYPRCPICGKSCTFKSIYEGFTISCGDPYCYQNLEEVNKKRQETVKENFGSLKAGYHDTAKKTIEEKLGVDNVSKLEEIKRRKKETSRKNCGADHHLQTEEGKENLRRAVQEKLGVDNVSQLEEIKRRKMETVRKNWGPEYDNPFQVPFIKFIIMLKYIRDFGVYNASQIYEVHDKKVKNKEKEYYIQFLDKTINYEGREDILLDYFVSLTHLTDITAQPESTIPYYDDKGKLHFTFPDVYIKLDDKDILIEGKDSNFIRNIHFSGVQLTKYKIIYGNALGFDYRLYFYNEDEQIFEVKFFPSSDGKEGWNVKCLQKGINNSIDKNDIKQRLEDIHFKNVITL